VNESRVQCTSIRQVWKRGESGSFAYRVQNGE